MEVESKHCKWHNGPNSFRIKRCLNNEIRLRVYDISRGHRAKFFCGFAGSLGETFSALCQASNDEDISKNKIDPCLITHPSQGL